MFCFTIMYPIRMSLSVHFCNFAIIISVASTKISWLIIGIPSISSLSLKTKKSIYRPMQPTYAQKTLRNHR